MHCAITRCGWVSGLVMCAVGTMGMMAVAAETPAGLAVPQLPEEAISETYRQRGD